MSGELADGPKPMRIGVLSFSFPRRAGDDAGIFVARLVDAWSGLGCSGTVVVPLDDREPALETRGRFSVIRCHYGFWSRGRLAFGAGIMPNLRRNPLLGAQIPGLLAALAIAAGSRAKEFDILHANWAVAALPALIASWRSKVPFVVTLRGEDLRLLRNSRVRSVFRPILRRARAVVTVSETLRNEALELLQLDPEKLICIPNGVDPEPCSLSEARELAEFFEIDPDARLLISVGTLLPRKRAELLVEAMSAPQLSGYTLLLCGRTSETAYLERIRGDISRLGLSGRVKILGQIAPHDVPKLMKLSAAYITASEFEGRPNAVLEAMAAGIPIIASDIPAHAEILSDGRGMLVDFSNPHSAAAKIGELLEDPRATGSLVGAALQFAADHSWRSCGLRYLELFEKHIRE